MLACNFLNTISKNHMLMTRKGRKSNLIRDKQTKNLHQFVNSDYFVKIFYRIFFKTRMLLEQTKLNLKN